MLKNVLKIKDANSTEIDSKTKNPIIDIIEGKVKETKSGILRIGDHAAKTIPNTIVANAYDNAKTFVERHRHKYEFTTETWNKYFKNSKLIYSSTSLDEKLIETIEITNHPFFLAQQYHGELTSKPTAPSPTYKSFIRAVIKNK